MTTKSKPPSLFSRLQVWIALALANTDLKAFHSQFRVTDDEATNDARMTYDFFDLRRQNLMSNQAIIFFGILFTFQIFPVLPLIVVWALFELIELIFIIEYGMLYQALMEKRFDRVFWSKQRYFVSLSNAILTFSIVMILLFSVEPSQIDLLIIIYLFILVLNSTLHFYSVAYNGVLIGVQMVAVIIIYFFLAQIHVIEVNLVNKISYSVLFMLSFCVSQIGLMTYSEFYRSLLKQEKMSYLIHNRLEENTRQISREKYIMERIQSTINDAFVVVDRNFKIYQTNRAFHKLFGIPSSNTTARGLRAYVDEGVLIADGKMRGLELPNGRQFNVQGWELQVMGEEELSLFVITDETERIAMDKLTQQSQKLNALGTLSGGIAHDFYNSLAVIQANVDLIERSDNLKEIKEEFLRDIRFTVSNATGLTRQILAFVRNTPLRITDVNVKTIARNSEQMMKYVLSHDHSFIVDCSTKASVFCDQALLHNALLNLVINARDAMPDGGKIVLEIADSSRQGYVRFSVIDHGVGIRPEDLDRVAEPFYTSKTQETGTGMGLTLVKQFTERHEGSFQILSKYGKGTNVTIELPRADIEQPVQALELPLLKQIRSHFNILIVDDNLLLARGLSRQLSMLGHETQISSTLAEIEKMDLKPFDIVLCDMLLASETGLDIYHHFQSKGIDSKFIFISGNIAPNLFAEVEKLKDATLLEKPFGLDELLNEIQKFTRERVES